MGAKGWIDVFWCELATLRPVVSPSSPIADNLEKKGKCAIITSISKNVELRLV